MDENLVVSPKRRVKVYHLSANSEWNDQGTGHVNISPLEDPKDSAAHVIVVTGEDDGSELLLAKIYAGDIYQRQQDTLIVWTDPESNKDLALSFQDPTGCNELWAEICAIQGRSPDAVHDYDMTAQEAAAAMYEEYVDVGVELPPADLGSLPDWAKLMQEVTPFRREKVAGAVVTAVVIPKFIEMFRQCEDIEDQSSLHSLFHVFKGLFLLNDPAIIELLVSEPVCMDVIGALEYDPDLPTQQHHRRYLQNVVIFKQIVPFQSDELLTKIHQTFRITYVKDVVLPRLLDDATFATLNSLIYFNNVEIVTYLQQDNDFLAKLFAHFFAPGATPAQRKDVVLFLEEFCTLAKNLDQPVRARFYSTLATHGVLEIFEHTMGDTDFRVRMASTDILTNIVTHDASMLRGYMLGQSSKGYALFAKIVQLLVTDVDQGMQVHLSEIVRVLIDMDNMDNTQKEEFLNVFYMTFIPKICEPFLKDDAVQVPDPMGPVKNTVCSLLAFCVQQHGYRMKYYLLGHGVAPRVLRLLDHSEMYLALGAIRFFRACVGMRDEFYNKYIIKQRLFDPIVERFVRNGRRTNLLNSAITELIEFINKENCKALIEHLVAEQLPKLNGHKFACVFEKLRLKYEQNRLAVSGGRPEPEEPVLAVAAPRRGMDTEEEDYFSREDDDDDEEDEPSSNASSPARQASAATASPGSLRRRSNSPPGTPSSMLRGSLSIRSGSASPERESPPRVTMQQRRASIDAIIGADQEPPSPRKREAEASDDQPAAKRMRTGGGYIAKSGKRQAAASENGEDIDSDEGEGFVGPVPASVFDTVVEA